MGEKTAAGQAQSRDGRNGAEGLECHLGKVEKDVWAGALEGGPGGAEGTQTQGQGNSDGQDAGPNAPGSGIEAVEEQE